MKKPCLIKQSDVVWSHHRLVELLQPIDCKVNLIVFNTHEGSRFAPSTPAAVQQFRSIVIQVTQLMQQIPALSAVVSSCGT